MLGTSSNRLLRFAAGGCTSRLGFFGYTQYHHINYQSNSNNKKNHQDNTATYITNKSFILKKETNSGPIINSEYCQKITNMGTRHFTQEWTLQTHKIGANVFVIYFLKKFQHETDCHLTVP